jgi:hypothetical protein
VRLSHSYDPRRRRITNSRAVLTYIQAAPRVLSPIPAVYEMASNWPRLLITFVAVYVLMQVCNFLVHGLWLAPTYASLAKVWRPDAQSKVWIIFVTDVFRSFFFCYIFVRGSGDSGGGHL